MSRIKTTQTIILVKLENGRRRGEKEGSNKDPRPHRLSDMPIVEPER